MESIVHLSALALSIFVPPLFLPAIVRRVRRKMGQRLVGRLREAPGESEALMKGFVKSNEKIQSMIFLQQLPFAGVLSITASILSGSLNGGAFVLVVSLCSSYGYLLLRDWSLLVKIKEDVLNKAYAGLVEAGDYHLIVPLLGPILKHSRRLEELKTAVLLLVEWGDQAAAEALVKFSQREGGKDWRVQEVLDRTKKTAASLLKQHRLLAHGDVPALLHLLEKSDGVYHTFKASKNHLRPSPEGGSEDVLAHFQRQQVALRDAPDQGFCTRCRVRPVTRPVRETPIFLCPICGHFDALIPGVATVVGIIGPATTGFYPPGRYEIDLWETSTRQVLVSEIDALELRPDPELNHDWAVAATVQMLQNHFSDPPRKIKIDIPAEIHLSSNSTSLLRQLEENSPVILSGRS